MIKSQSYQQIIAGHSPNIEAKKRVERSQQQASNFNKVRQSYRGSMANTPTFKYRALKQINHFMHKAGTKIQF